MLSVPLGTVANNRGRLLALSSLDCDSVPSYTNKQHGGQELAVNS
jgi:hypothetical protein